MENPKDKLQRIRKIYNKLQQDKENEGKYVEDLSELPRADKLDLVLAYIQTIKEPPFQYFSEISDGLKQNGISFGKYSDELSMILLKLVKDEYVQVEIENHGNNNWRYYLTYTGDEFLEKDGYRAKYKREKWQRRWVLFTKTAAIVGFLILLKQNLDIKQILGKEEQLQPQKALFPVLLKQIDTVFVDTSFKDTKK